MRHGSTNRPDRSEMQPTNVLTLWTHSPGRFATQPTNRQMPCMNRPGPHKITDRVMAMTCVNEVPLGLSRNADPPLQDSSPPTKAPSPGKSGGYRVKCVKLDAPTERRPFALNPMLALHPAACSRPCPQPPPNRQGMFGDKGVNN